MDQAEDDINACDRDTYRADVPGPVKDAVLQYLYGVKAKPSSHVKEEDKKRKRNGSNGVSHAGRVERTCTIS